MIKIFLELSNKNYIHWLVSEVVFLGNNCHGDLDSEFPKKNFTIARFSYGHFNPLVLGERLHFYAQCVIELHFIYMYSHVCMYNHAVTHLLLSVLSL